MTGKRSARSRAIAAAMALACLVAACRAPTRGTGRRGPAVAVEPKAEYADLDRIHAVISGLHGRPVFVNFWATWCVPCVDELPLLGDLSREPDVRNAAFLGISLDSWVTGDGKETEDRVKRALTEAGIGYPNLIYRGDQDPLIESLGLPGPIPYSVLYDARGKEIASWTGEAAIQEVRRAIAAAAPPGPAPAPHRSPQPPAASR